MRTLVRFLPAAVAALVLVAALALTSQLVPLPPPARTAASIAIALSVLIAAFVRRPDIQSRASVALALVGATAAGQAKIGVPYALLGVVLVLACLAAMRAVRRPRERALGTTRVAPLAVMFGVAGGVFALLAASLPPASVRVERYFIDSFAQHTHAMGFGSTLQLGTMRGMLVNNRPVLEVEGERVDYLRGAVLNLYERHTWRASREMQASTEHAATSPRPNGTTRIVFVPGARLPRNENARFFLPWGACEPGTPSGRTRVDAGGIVFPDGSGDEQIWFRSSGCERISVMPPQRLDTGILRHHRAALEDIATRWIGGATTDREKLAAIERELSRFQYSLEGDEYWKTDPILEFLTTTKSGYCEQFAVGMVLLARAQKIPARVVTGYRVPPASSITGRTIVRERNAHAWVEAWVDGAWHTYDPTPLSESMAGNTTMEDIGDAVSYGLERAWDAIGNLSLVKASILLAVLVVAFAVVRRVAAIRAGRGRGRRGPAEALPSFDALATALAKGGVLRDEAEPLERFARRLRSRDEPWAKDVADVLVRYAALRYGGIGDESEVAKAAQAAARRVPTS